MIAGNGESHLDEWRRAEEFGSKLLIAAYGFMDMERKALLDTGNSDKDCSMSDNINGHTKDELSSDNYE